MKKSTLFENRAVEVMTGRASPVLDSEPVLFDPEPVLDPLEMGEEMPSAPSLSPDCFRDRRPEEHTDGPEQDFFVFNDDDEVNGWTLKSPFLKVVNTLKHPISTPWVDKARDLARKIGPVGPLLQFFDKDDDPWEGEPVLSWLNELQQVYGAWMLSNWIKEERFDHIEGCLDWNPDESSREYTGRIIFQPPTIEGWPAPPSFAIVALAKARQAWAKRSGAATIPQIESKDRLLLVVARRLLVGLFGLQPITFGISLRLKGKPKRLTMVHCAGGLRSKLWYELAQKITGKSEYKVCEGCGDFYHPDEPDERTVRKDPGKPYFPKPSARRYCGPCQKQHKDKVPKMVLELHGAGLSIQAIYEKVLNAHPKSNWSKERVQHCIESPPRRLKKPSRKQSVASDPKEPKVENGKIEEVSNGQA